MPAVDITFQIAGVLQSLQRLALACWEGAGDCGASQAAHCFSVAGHPF